MEFAFGVLSTRTASNDQRQNKASRWENLFIPCPIGLDSIFYSLYHNTQIPVISIGSEIERQKGVGALEVGRFLFIH